jgi:hypothetical protein
MLVIILYQITLNMSAISVIISFLGFALAVIVFGYRIKNSAEIKTEKDLKAKVDCTYFEEFKKVTNEKIATKVNQCEFDKFYAEIWQGVDEVKLKNQLDIAKIESNITHNQNETRNEIKAFGEIQNELVVQITEVATNMRWVMDNIKRSK